MDKKWKIKMNEPKYIQIKMYTLRTDLHPPMSINYIIIPESPTACCNWKENIEKK